MSTLMGSRPAYGPGMLVVAAAPHDADSGLLVCKQTEAETAHDFLWPASHRP